ncbi:hypothetical protein RDV84_00140 [Lysobacter yananisis]|uniref:DUF2163 domain-containing protein n=1 Tax=Lysobacter yananisis TaxID=1003114 RepID=A0ABY9P8R8_9GAMM|nr:phage BR0599 family protein [Lysobacter yananisis]WMT03299.1 hypothetical protein RDV84_00140 [Lysobacter yananisis]
MTFEQRDQSYYEGEPLVLYLFVRGAELQRYVSGQSDYTYNGQPWRAVPGGISITPINENGETPQLTRTLTIPRSLEVARWWWPVVGRAPVSLIVMDTHAGDPEALVQWMGRVVAPQYKNAGTLELKCQPERTASMRRANTRRWQPGCPLLVYSQGNGQCNAIPAQHAITATVDNVTGLTVQSAGFLAIPEGRLAGGYIEYDMPGGYKETADIEGHNGAAITLAAPSTGLTPGMSLVALPGCGGDWASCEFLGNTDNYGGQLYAPDRSPFDGNPNY